MESYNSRSWLRSELLGSRTEEIYLLASIDVTMKTAHWLYPFRVLFSLLLYSA